MVENVHPSRTLVPLARARLDERLERVYVEMFDGFARMITVGDFPFGAEETEVDELARTVAGEFLPALGDDAGRLR